MLPCYGTPEHIYYFETPLTSKEQMLSSKNSLLIEYLLQFQTTIHARKKVDSQNVNDLLILTVAPHCYTVEFNKPIVKIARIQRD